LPSSRLAADPVNSSDVSRLLLDLWSDLHELNVLWQLAVLGAALMVAWWAGRLVEPRLEGGDQRLHFTLGGLQRLQFPLTALVFVLIGRATLKHWHSVRLLDVAVPLLTALAIVRVVLYVLRRVFAPSGWLRSSERTISWMVWVGVAVYIAGLAPDVIGFFEAVGFSVGDQRISLLLVLEGLLVVSATLLGALWLGSAIESRLMGAQQLDMNLRVVLSKLTRAILAVVALLLALRAVGFDLTLLSVFSGALGVGLGFGLQKIASNYVSGFIILMDRSISLSDMISVDRFTGQITKITARYVVLRGLDGTETLVPNETLVASPVVNLSYSDSRVRGAVTVFIDYGSDFEAAMRILEDAAKSQKRVLRDPAPLALIKQLGENGIELELGYWVEDPHLGLADLRSEIQREVLKGFRASDIRVPMAPREPRAPGERWTA
jgi:small-conductance mechanosensitive channel